MMRLLGILALLAWVTMQSAGQVVSVPDSTAGRNGTGTLSIQADLDSAIVLIDSAKAGVTPLVVRDVQPGLHRLKIIHPDMTNWLTTSILDSVQIHAGEEKVLRYAFPKRYLILSVPSGAEVFTGDSLRGSTPYLLSLSGSDTLSPIVLRRTGYDSTRVNLSEARRGIVSVSMKNLGTTDQREEDLDETDVTQKRDTFPVFLAGAATVGFGIAAAYFKVQADNKNERFLLDNSASSRSQIRVYDTAAAICLGLAEVGFGFFSYFLLAE